MYQRTPEITIIGGGLVGLSVALGLLKIDEVKKNAALKNNEALRFACKNNMKEVAHKLLEQKCVKDNAVAFDNAALSWACAKNMQDVALELLHMQHNHIHTLY